MISMVRQLYTDDMKTDNTTTNWMFPFPVLYPKIIRYSFDNTPQIFRNWSGHSPQRWQKWPRSCPNIIRHMSGNTPKRIRKYSEHNPSIIQTWSATAPKLIQNNIRRWSGILWKGFNSHPRTIPNIYNFCHIVISCLWDHILFLYTNRKDLSCSLLILWLSSLLWHIHIRGQSLNCDSIIVFMIKRNFSCVKYFEMRINAWSFLLPSFNIKLMCSSDLSVRSILTPSNLTESSLSKNESSRNI